jgi:hypothetical protein
VQGEIGSKTSPKHTLLFSTQEYRTIVLRNTSGSRKPCISASRRSIKIQVDGIAPACIYFETALHPNIHRTMVRKKRQSKGPERIRNKKIGNIFNVETHETSAFAVGLQNIISKTVV